MPIPGFPGAIRGHPRLLCKTWNSCSNPQKRLRLHAQDQSVRVTNMGFQLPRCLRTRLKGVPRGCSERKEAHRGHALGGAQGNGADRGEEAGGPGGAPRAVEWSPSLAVLGVGSASQRILGVDSACRSDFHYPVTSDASHHYSKG